MDRLHLVHQPLVQGWGQSISLGDDIVDRTAISFLDALLSADRTAALCIATSALDHGLSVADVHLHVVQESMARIGCLWEEGRISVAAEHTASAIAQFVVTSLYPMMQRKQAMRGHAVVAGVAGEAHQLGAHLVSDALEADGWQVRFLGVDCSQAAILAACVDPHPNLLALSCTMPGNLHELQQVITSLRKLWLGDSSPRVLVGGQAFGTGKDASDRALCLGADAYAADLTCAVTAARSWDVAQRQGNQCTEGEDER